MWRSHVKSERDQCLLVAVTKQNRSFKTGNAQINMCEYLVFWGTDRIFQAFRKFLLSLINLRYRGQATQ